MGWDEMRWRFGDWGLGIGNWDFEDDRGGRTMWKCT